MASESWYKTDLVTKLKRLGGYARRVEDQFAVGILDMIIVLPGMPVLFAEGKLMKGNLLAPTERQWIEGERIRKATHPLIAMPVLFGWKDGVFHVAEWGKERRVDECVVEMTGDTAWDTIDRWWKLWQTTEKSHQESWLRRQELLRRTEATNMGPPKIHSR